MDNYENPFLRTEWLIGPEALETLRGSHVAVFGVGGVGSFTAEALARCGVGTLTLIDHDVITLTNLNRQLHALHSTLGQRKVEVMRARILDINPEATVHALPLFFMDETEADGALTWAYDYVVDAVDTVTAKLRIVMTAKLHGLPIISAMGAGNRLDPLRFQVADIYKTQGCPLAKVMRQLCRRHQVDSLKVVYSTEPPRDTPTTMPVRERGRIGSIAFAPSVAGLIAAGEVIRDLTAGTHKKGIAKSSDSC